jgi:hypothetical protein
MDPFGPSATVGGNFIVAFTYHSTASTTFGEPAVRIQQVTNNDTQIHTALDSPWSSDVCVSINANHRYLVTWTMHYNPDDTIYQQFGTLQDLPPPTSPPPGSGSSSSSSGGSGGNATGHWNTHFNYHGHTLM